jgi:Phage Tail Collar Domain
MGQGYTRQSAAEIFDGETIDAIDHNREFNQLQNAFSGTTGHSHDGTTGNGPKVSLTSSVIGVLPVANGGTGGLSNLTATTDPTAASDSNDGYTEGSIWVNVTTDKVWFCTDATGGAAVWKTYQILDQALQSISDLTTASDKMIYTTASDTYAAADLTPYARTLLDDADVSTAQTTLGISAYGKTLVDDADAATARSTLGLGSVALQNASSVALTGGSAAGLSITGGSISNMVDITVADGGTGASDATGARANLGLSNVDNTSDANKPISTATQTALDLKAPLASPALTGAPTAPTATALTNNTQVATTAYVDTAISVHIPVPAGAILPFAMDTAPSGWLEANGAAVSRTTYATLFANIGITWGAGNGITTFNIPDLRGEFVRGWDNGKGTDPARTFASFQSDLIKEHNHATGLQTVTTPGYGVNNGSTFTSISPPGLNTANSGGSETRPRNFALLYCIKT